MKKDVRTLPSPPESWTDLDWEDLQYIFSAETSGLGSFEFKRRVLFHIMGWELVGKSYIDMPYNSQEVTGSEVERMELLCKQVEEMQAVLDGEGDTIVVVRDKATGELFEFSAELLFGWLHHYMKFLDSPDGFTALPEDKVRIGKHTFQLPQPMLANLTYQQYLGAQSAISDMEYYRTILDETAKGKREMPEHEVLKFAEGYKRCRCEFLANMLTPRRFIFFDNKGGRFSVQMRYSFVYDADRVQDNVAVMALAPDWLFSLCYMFYCGCAEEFSKKFRFLFSSSGGGTSDPLMAELDCINNVMKYQGYSEQQEVYDSNAVFVLSVLNRMAEEAKEIEKMKIKKR